MLLPDHETSVDLLNYEAIARTTVRLLEENKNQPITIGIHGQWGAGKSSVLKMVENAVSERDNVAYLQFNGWAFEGFDDSKTVLIESIVQELIRQRSAISKVKDIGTNILKRINWIKAAKYGASAAVTLATGFPPPSIAGDLIGLIGKAGEKLKGINADDIVVGLEEAKTLLEGPNLAQISEEIHYIREEFRTLLEEAKIDQLIVLIDDLDRCLPATAIHTLEAIKLFLFVPKTAFIIAADDAMIEYAVKQHFPDLPLSSGPSTYARNYLEKLIQVPFRIPELGSEESKVYITLLLVQNIVGEGSPGFQKLLALAREQLKRPWLGIHLDQKDIQAVDAAKKGDLNAAYFLALQIAPILSKGTRGNPRQIKRFLNTLLLRRAIAEERGFGDDIKIPALAKLMLAENFKPGFYSEIARLSMAAEDGKVADLSILEDDSKKSKSSKGKEEEKDTLHPWLEQPWLIEWAKIDPVLKDIDLRPYVFVARDKRIIIEDSAGPDGLGDLIDKLKGGSLALSTFENEIKVLPEEVTRQAFNMLRENTLREGMLQKPPGFDGLRALAKHHKYLQADLLTFIGSLEVNDVGIWVVSGWEGIITDDAAKKNLNEILIGWSKQDSNKVLRKVAQQAISTKGKQ